ncbi:hypothetical protein ACVMIH_003884 [Bradyrhizobium sp. USDA 4503]
MIEMWRFVVTLPTPCRTVVRVLWGSLERRGPRDRTCQLQWRCVLLSVRYAPIATKIPHRREMTRLARKLT